jgi:CubicO group peptidase (beta-lactamase class C family)
MRTTPCAGRDWKIIPVLLGFLVLSVLAIAQDLPAGKPESVGLSTERLERIGTAVQREIDDKRIAGAVTLVIRHGRVALFKSQGMMDREAAKPMRPDAMFRICSMTKPITSVAVMMLYEEGRFLLDDPVSKYLPEFKNPKVLVKPASGEPYSIPVTKEITIRECFATPQGLLTTGIATLGPCMRLPVWRADCCSMTARSGTA